jgi:iron complex outermembrane recepter protein
MRMRAPAVSLAVLACPLPALAQSSSMDADDLIVTATKRERSNISVPISVSSLDDRRLGLVEMRDTQALQYHTTALAFTQGAAPATSSIVIRGIATYAVSDAIRQSVALVTDGIANTRAVDQAMQLVDVERIEVLRGPQTTLFGTGATAGLVQVVSRAPESERSLTLEAGLGSRDEQRFEAVLNQPLENSAAARLALWSFRRDGFIAAPNQGGKLGDLDDWGGRFRFRLEATARLRLDLIATLAGRDASGGSQTHRAYLGYAFSAALQQRDLANGVVAGPDNDATAANGPFFDRSRSQSYVLDARFDWGSTTLTSLTGLRRLRASNAFDADISDSMPPAPNIYLNDSTAQTTQWSQEVRLASRRDSPFDYVIGLYGESIDADSHYDQAATGLAPIPLARSADIALWSRTGAVFAEGDLQILPRVALISGVRVAYTDMTGDFRRTIPPMGIAIAGGPFAPLTLRNSVDNLSAAWRVGAEWRPSADAMFYAIAAHGDKAPGLNYTSDTTTTLGISPPIRVAPESATSVELGWKAVLSSRLSMQTALYHATYRDLQVTTLLPTLPTSFAIVNAPALRSEGFEGELSYRGDRHYLKAAIAYSNARFTNFRNAPCYPGQTAAAGCLPVGLGTAYDVSGSSPPDSPHWTFNLSGGFEHPLGPRLQAFVEMEYSYKDGVHYGLGSNPADREGARDLVNIGLGMRSVDRKTEVRVFCRNLFDARFANRLVPNNGALVQYLPYESRASYGLILRHRI